MTTAGDDRTEDANGSASEIVGPITVSPDPKAWRERRDKIPRWLRGVWDYVVVPADPPERFATGSLPELAEKLKTDNEAVAKAVLAEAEATYAEPLARIEGAERRATTLQGAVAIAASVALAGGGLLLDQNRIPDRGWRIAIASALITFALCLIASGVRALGATSRMFNFEEPGLERVFDRASMSPAEALTHRAAELLRAFAVSDMIGSVKVGLLRAAAWWFRWALFFLAVLALLLGAYTISGAQNAAPATHKKQTVVSPTHPSHPANSARQTAPGAHGRWDSHRPSLC